MVQTGIAHMLRFLTVRRSGPVFMSMVGYLIPMFATVLGVVLLGESLSMAEIGAFGLILGGLAVAQSRQWRPAAPRAGNSAGDTRPT